MCGAGREGGLSTSLPGLGLVPGAFVSLPVPSLALSAPLRGICKWCRTLSSFQTQEVFFMVAFENFGECFQFTKGNHLKGL